MSKINNRVKVLIDPNSHIQYGSYYIKGLMDAFGRRNIKFTRKPFVGLGPVGWNIRFILKQEGKNIKVFIHTDDPYHIDMNNYNWCDIYGNVNANFEHYPKKDYPKQVSLVPSFGIRIFSLFDTIYFSITNLLKGFKDILNNSSYNINTKKFEQSGFKNVIRHVLNYLKNYFKRIPLEYYYNQAKIKSNYIFFLSTLWYSNDSNKNDEGVNRRRANFIEACKEIKNISFEGGLLANSSSSSELFKDCVTYNKISLNSWIEKTKESILVFNTPAFWNCHGWKLGEYLALGKAIISTPLSNDLPVPLIHGEHIHIVNNDSKEEIKKAILYLANNDEYRKKLETNVKAYWEKFGTPQKSLELLGLIPANN
jgi:hypothetical protein